MRKLIRRPRVHALALALALALSAAAVLALAAAAKPFDPNAPKKPPPAAGPKPKGGPAVPKLARRVVMVSLEGAAMETLQQLWRDDELDEGGFARFFREGQVATLLPVDPPLTWPNHASLASGYAPSHTGIAGDEFHPAGAPPFVTVSGRDAANGCETLWEALRRQKRLAAVVAWPGAGDTTPRRRADLGLSWLRTAQREPRLLELKRSDWQPAAAGAPKLDSRSPVLTAQITLDGPDAPPPFVLYALGHGGDDESYDTLVMASADAAAAAARAAAGAAAASGAKKGRGAAVSAPPATPVPSAASAGSAASVASVASVAGAGAPAKAPAPAVPAGAGAAVAELRQSEALVAGDWTELSFPDHGGRGIAYFKVLAIDPALATVRLYFSGSFQPDVHPRDLALDVAETNLFWPGEPDDPRLVAGWKEEEGGIDLGTWTEQADHLAGFLGGVMQVIAARDDWQLLLGDLPVIGMAGRRLLLTDARQEGYSEARRDELARARLKVWRAADRELRQLLAELDLGRTTVVVVSDHGMAPVHTMIDLNALLRERGQLAAATPPAAPEGGAAAGGGSGAAAAAGGAGGPGSGGAYVIGDGGMAHLYLAESAGRPPAAGAAGEAGDARAAGAADPAARRQLLADLRDQLLAWRVGDEQPIERVLNQQEAVELGLDHPNAGDLVIFAREGYAFDPGPRPGGSGVTHPAQVYGMPGYLSSHTNMQGIYLAIGKDIKPGTTGGPVQAIDLASRIAGWLGIEKPRVAAPGGGAAAPH